jgi:membrane-associated phospholipid phosphatase
VPLDGWGGMAKVKHAAKKLHRADRKTAQAAAKAKDTPVMRAAAVVAEAGDQPPLILLSSATLAFGLLTRRPAMAQAGARMLASHLLATAIKTVIKRSVDRTRPHSVQDGKPYTLQAGDSRSHHYSSFPSGHTAGAVAVARAAARIYPDATPIFAAAATGIGALQLPIGKHYGSDVAAGAVVGLVSEAVVDGMANWLIGGSARKSLGVVGEQQESGIETP